MNNKLIVAPLLGFMMMGAVGASAAQITNTVPKLGASTDTVASCDTTINSSWVSAYESAIPGYEVGTYTVGAGGTLDGAACNGATVKVTLIGAGDVSLAEATAVIAAADTSKAIDFSGSNIHAKDVVKSAVVIVGP